MERDLERGFLLTCFTERKCSETDSRRFVFFLFVGTFDQRKLKSTWKLPTFPPRCLRKQVDLTFTTWSISPWSRTRCHWQSDVLTGIVRMPKGKFDFWKNKQLRFMIHDSTFFFSYVRIPFFGWWIFIGYSEQEEMLVEKLGWNPEASSGGPSMFRWQLVLVDVESLVTRNCSTRSLSVKGKLWKTPKEFCKVCWKPSEVKWFSLIILVCFDDFGISDCGVEGGITHLRTIHHV